MFSFDFHPLGRRLQTTASQSNGASVRRQFNHFEGGQKYKPICLSGVAMLLFMLRRMHWPTFSAKFIFKTNNLCSKSFPSDLQTTIFPVKDAPSNGGKPLGAFLTFCLSTSIVFHYSVLRRRDLFTVIAFVGSHNFGPAVTSWRLCMQFPRLTHLEPIFSAVPLSRTHQLIVRSIMSVICFNAFVVSGKHYSNMMKAKNDKHHVTSSR